jgi:CRP-like cAMP-binding protein
MSLFHTHPQLAAKLFWSFSCEAAVYAEHLIAIGRRSALERVAHFLLELLTRLQAVGLADERSFRLPLTQELIADALGLSIPYVNQVLRQLRDDDLVCIKDKLIVINDVEALSALVDFERTYLKPLSIVELLNEAA